MGSFDYLNDFETSSIFLCNDGYDFCYLKRDSFLIGGSSKDPEYKGKLTGFTQSNHSYTIPIIKGFNSIAFDSVSIYDFMANHRFGIKEYEFSMCYATSIYFHYSDTISIDIDESYVKKIALKNCAIKEFYGSSYIDTLDFSKCILLNIPDLELEEKPSSISLDNCKFRATDEIWDLDNIWNEKSEKKCLLRINKTDISKIKFKYSEFTIDTTGLSYEQIQSLYNNIKEQYTKLGMTESLQLVEIDLIKLNNHHKGGFYKFIDLVNFYWWNYGYDKGKVVTNSMLLFLIFLVLNLCVGLNRLLIHGYSLSTYNNIPTLIKSYKTRYRKVWAGFWYTFLFTCLIFWGINLDKKELHFRNLGYIFYILFQYLIGFVCLAYLAAFILSK
ncbi:MAG: hypothetical protein QM731_00085 [Chitinophagaceae bacterium]